MPGKYTLAMTKIGLATGASGDKLSALFETRGAEVVLARAVEIVPAPQARIEAEIRRILDLAPEWTIASTARGLFDLAGRDSPLHTSTRSMLVNKNLAVRGAKSAQMATRMHITPAVVAESGRSADLVRLVGERTDRRTTIGLQASGSGSLALRALLTREGYDVLVAQPYRCSPPSDKQALVNLAIEVGSAEVDFVVFTSSSAVCGFAEVAEDAGVIENVRAALDSATVAIGIGPSTCEALERVGVSRSTCPVRPVLDSLPAFVAALAERPEPTFVALDSRTRSARVARGEMTFGRYEFRLFAALSRRPGIVCPPKTLMLEVWGSEVGFHRLVSLIHRLRRQVGPAGVEIDSLRKRGYRMRVR